MISPADIDEGKTRLLLSHLNKALDKVNKREESRKKLREQMEKVRKASRSKAHMKEMKELEKRLADVIEKEQEMIMHHRARESFNRRIKDKIDELETKLSRYLAAKRKRGARIKELEKKIKRRFAAEQKEIEILEEQIMGIEEMYRKISGEKTHTKDELDRVKKKIESLKERLSKIK